jgi:glycosyltransferase involved in cell wall biosynthesis
VSTNRAKATPTVSVCGAVSSGALQLVSNAVKGAGYSSRVFSVLDEPSYRGASGGGVWSRWQLRFRIHAAYPLQFFWAAIRARRSDVFIVTTNPFFALFAAKAGCFFSRAKTVWLIHDLYPEALEAGGVLRPSGFVARVFGLLTKLGLRTASATVFLGEVLGTQAEDRWGRARQSAVIPPVSAFDQASQPAEPLSPDGLLRLLYSGHLGHLHAVDTLIACVRAALQELPEKVAFQFQVSGPFVSKLRVALANEKVVIEPTKSSPAEHQAALAASDLALVSLSPLGALAAYPSKTFSALAVGRPVLAVCPVWSDVGKMLGERDAGWVVSNSDTLQEELGAEIVAERFVGRLKEMLENRSLVADRSRRARMAFEEIGAEERLMQAWKKVMENVVGS